MKPTGNQIGDIISGAMYYEENADLPKEQRQKKDRTLLRISMGEKNNFVKVTGTEQPGDIEIHDWGEAGLIKKSYIRLTDRCSNPTVLRVIGRLTIADKRKMLKALEKCSNYKTLETEELDDEFDMHLSLFEDLTDIKN